MARHFVMVDLFAGPGGLSEGFWNFRLPSGERPFRTGLSVEKEASAHATLLFRNFYRKFDGDPPPEYHSFLGGGEEPGWADIWPTEWKAASSETLLHELQRRRNGEGDELLDPLLDELRDRTHGDVILLGGPPCQAYSLVGRARNAGNSSYRPEKDERHFLYEEYLRILARLRPAAFVMENVRGFLSSRVGQTRIFNRVLEDLDGLAQGQDGYQLFAAGQPMEGGLPGIARERQPTDFLVRAEELGIPQMRHRVFIIGVRKDCLAGPGQYLRLKRYPKALARHVLDGLPPLRSGLSRNDSPDKWRETVQAALSFLQYVSLEGCSLQEQRTFARLVSEVSRDVDRMARLPRRSTGRGQVASDCPDHLARWLVDPRLENIPNHETRGHMPSDLARYMFVILHGLATGKSPKAQDFPEELAPDHRNWKTGKFADRFRVQLPDRPASTITAHISKDGHYFIHPDPRQCRSLTVREAARLQTFPDNYLFRGNRTQQYVQVGNAVPPLLANLLAEAIYELIEGGETSNFRK